MKTVTEYFTFGQTHMCNHPRQLGRLADHFVAVELPEGFEVTHREIFIAYFTQKYCPSENQFAFQYPEDRFRPEYFPAGELVRITEEGEQ